MTTKSRKKEDENFSRKYDIGDLVKVRGYDHEVYRIDGYTYAQIRYSDEAWNELEYELSRVTDAFWLDGYEEDMTLVCRANEAESYIRRITRKSKRTRKTDAERVDALLAELSDTMALRDTFGDDEENDYSAKIKRIKARLRSVSRNSG